MAAGDRPSWRATHHDQDLRFLRGKRFQRELFANCQLEDVRGTIFEHCCMIYTRFEPKSLSDMLGVTLTLDCFTFDGFHWNELAMDAMLYLLSMTAGNDERRAILRRMVRPESLIDFEKLFEKLECWNR